jgi:hypothetical protein
MHFAGEDPVNPLDLSLLQRAFSHRDGDALSRAHLTNRFSFLFYEAIISESGFHFHSVEGHIPYI